MLQTQLEAFAVDLFNPKFNINTDQSSYNHWLFKHDLFSQKAASTIMCKLIEDNFLSIMYFI